MAKKKKTQLKPVARGFATTSVPKKVVPEDTVAEADTPAGTTEEEKSTTDDGPAADSVATQATSDEFDPEKVEEQSLQNLVDSKQDKIEKEIARTIKVIEADRRYSKTLPRLELDPVLIERILDLVLESDIGEGKKSVDEPEDKAISKLGITYGVLRRLGFSEERVEECLRAIRGVELDEAYDWLYLHCSEDELEDKNVPESMEPRTPRTPRGPSLRTPHTPRTPAQFLAYPPPPPTPTLPTPSRLDANAAPFIPSFNRMHKATPPSDSDPESEPAPAPLIISQDSDSSDSGNDSLATEDTNLEYARLKLKIAKLTSDRLPGDKTESSELRNLQTRLQQVKKHYFFDEKDAEAQYRVEREKAEAVALQARLRGTSTTSLAPSPKFVKKRPPNLQPPPPQAAASTDIFDEDIGDSVGGLLEALEDMPTTVTNDHGTVVNVRDMALPKHWSGRTPKILLAETVSKADRYAAISYIMLSGASRVKRASVSIRWDGKKTDEWSMDNVGCHTEGQAEQYIATIALHELTFPEKDAFTAPAPSGGQTFFRLLPAVFRDLWEELETSRKVNTDALNRGVWAKLRSIIEPKLEPDVKANGKGSKHLPEAKATSIHRPAAHVTELASEQIAAGFRARQASPAYQEMLTHRNLLPIAQYRQEIIQTLEDSQVLVLSGETGCGKSTQVPTFILEDQLSRGKPCKIYCTEPRRISAISLAQRVSRELGDSPNAVGTAASLVGYSIRLESNTSKNTRLAFVTNGIALRMLEGGSGQGGSGTAFDEITHIIIDEVHERTIESDFLLIVLKSLIQQRPELKVILMSATVDAEKISEFFGGCPTLHVPGRTFPVDVHYLEDALEYTQWEITETSPYARRLHDKFYRGKNRTDWSEDMAMGDDDDEDSVQENVKLEKRYSPKTAATINLLDDRLVPYDLIVRLLEQICFGNTEYGTYSAAILIFMPGMGEIRRLNDMLVEHPAFGSDGFRIYPLHSTLSSENQGAVFDVPPPNIRKIVIATNIAETGITIPDITCVIDSGKHREMRFDEKRQISRLVETFVARSNAAQRRGRAGRVQRGLCFHLFTKVRHDTVLAEHPLPEMMRLSLSDLALRIKIMKVKLGSSIEDVLSRALDPPVSINVQRAIAMLVEVGALTSAEEITPMGRLLSKLPTDVHLGKFLLTATLLRCLDPALTIAAALNSKSPFVSPFGHEQEADRAKVGFRTDNSDFLTIHNAFASWRRASSNPSSVRKFCRVNYLSHQNLQQIEELRQQFLGYLIDSNFIQVDKAFIRDLNRARGRNRTRFVMVPPELDVNNAALLNAALTAGLYPKILNIDPSNGQMRTITNNQLASFHPSSVNFGRKPTDFGVNHLAYFTLMHSKKLYVWETGPVDDAAMLCLCGDADFRLVSNAAFIDRKVKYQLSPKCNVAFKFLRMHLSSILALQFRSRPLIESQVLWNDIALSLLGKEKFAVE
ncbi:P-loop containing nucleoside triphosphate hydrolase protein [Roridomyces roridus]|uniref:RNA helicase n=1 Tax=Roridomyces roridus TaxID=1738132 RepID=A0AAD7BUM0_9AGAR|nr:P-loop containing nucleoside triphosphate hydrolase protein [Roridomyces roridus]